MEPERKIEKWLRAFARKRREQSGAPLELHPATRRMLRSEAARRAPERREGNLWLSLVAILRPRLALIVPVVAVSIIGAWLLLPALKGARTKSTQLAGMSESRGVTDKVTGPAVAPSSTPEAPPPAAVAVPSVSTIQPALLEKQAGVADAISLGGLKDEFKAGAQDEKLMSAQPAREIASATTPAAPARPGAVSAAGANLAWRAEAEQPFTQGMPVQQQATQTAPGAESGVGAFSMATAPTAQNSLRLDNAPLTGGTGAFGVGVDTRASWVAGSTPNQVRYYRIDAESVTALNGAAIRRAAVPAAGVTPSVDTATDALPVLTSFAVEQSGRELRVVDSDGSVYSGYLQPDNAPSGRALTDAAAASAQGALAPTKQAGATENFETAQNYFFRVSGTNRSLRQSVEFSGNLFPITNGVPFEDRVRFSGGVNAGTAGRSQLQLAPAGLPQLPLLNSRISGTALIDNSRKLEINAAPAQSPR